MVFKSKVDAWILALVFGGPLVSVGIVLSLAFTVRGAGAALAFGAVVVAASLAFTAWVFSTTDYRIESGVLTIRSGPFRWRVPVPAIATVTATSNPLSSPALSLDRLAIRYRKENGRERTIMVSPANKNGFIAALREANPNIRSA